MRCEGIFEALRADGQEPVSAVPPHERTGRPQRLIVDDVQGDDIATFGDLSFKRIPGAAGLERDKTDQPDMS